MSDQKFFIRVDYTEFRRRMNRDAVQVSRSGYETVLFDAEGDILGIMHAASIDEHGRCHPTEYYLRRVEFPAAEMSLVA